MFPQLITFFTAMLPIIELRGAIPLGMLYGLTAEEAFIWATLGNMIPNFFILKFLDPISEWLMKKSKLCNRFLTRLFENTRAKHSQKFETVGAIFLITFIAIPLPGTGSWTGSLIAWIFKIPYWKAIGLISLGIIGAGILVTAGITSITKIIEIFF